MPISVINDSVNLDSIAGGSEHHIWRASVVIRWVAIAALAVALGLFYVLTTNAEDLIGTVRRVADGKRLTVRTAQNLDYRIRSAGIDVSEKRQPSARQASLVV